MWNTVWQEDIDEYDEEELYYRHQAEQEQHRDMSEEENHHIWLWGIQGFWEKNNSLGAGILLFLYCVN